MLVFIEDLKNEIVASSASIVVGVSAGFGGFLADGVEVPDDDGFVLGSRSEVVAAGLVDRDSPDPLGVPVRKRVQTVS